jgi:hypothetical protein
VDTLCKLDKLYIIFLFSNFEVTQNGYCIVIPSHESYYYEFFIIYQLLMINNNSNIFTFDIIKLFVII